MFKTDVMYDESGKKWSVKDTSAIIKSSSVTARVLLEDEDGNRKTVDIEGSDDLTTKHGLYPF